MSENKDQLETLSDTSSQENEQVEQPASVRDGLNSQRLTSTSARSGLRSSARNYVTHMTSETELAQKTEILQQELEELIQLTDQLRQERSALEEAIKERDRELIETTQLLEAESDTLANARRELREKRNEVSVLNKKNETMNNVTALNRLTAERQANNESRSRSNVTPLDDDDLQKIVDLTNEKRLRVQKIEDLQSEIETLNDILTKKVAVIESHDEKIKDFQWKEDHAYELECTNNELTYQIENLEKEIKTLQQITRMKTNTIEKLNNQIAEWKDFEEEHKATLKVYQYKEQELKNISIELENVQSENLEKEEEIQRILDSRDVQPVKTLSSDKAFLQSEMKKGLDEKTTLEKTIKWQEKQIQMLQSRLQAINVALKEAKLTKALKPDVTKVKKDGERPDSDQVPIHLHLLMIHNLLQLEKRAKSLELLLEEKNLIAESLVTKLENYEKEKIDQVRAFRKESQDLKTQLIEANVMIQQNEELYKEEENELKAKNIGIKKKLFEMQTKTVASPRA